MIKSCVTFFPVNNIEETVRFYRDIIGLKLYNDFGNCVILNCGEGFWGFCDYGDGRELPLGVCLSLNLQDNGEVDKEYERLSKLNISGTKPENHSVFPVYSFFIKDPNGYTVEFQKINED